MGPNYQFQFAQVFDNFGLLVGGLWTTFGVAADSFVLACVLGFVAAQLRLSRRASLRRLATAYVDFFRTTPFLVQLVWIFYCVPLVFRISLDTIQSAILALGLYYGANLAEVFRAGVASLARGQTEAGLALGMSGLQMARRVIYPQAIRRVLPPLGSSTVSLVKDTSITSVIGVPELMNAAQNLQLQLFRPLEVLTVAAIMYLIATYPIAWIADTLHRRYASEVM